MTLSAHLIVGAALAKMVVPEQPLLAFVVGTASHFVLDVLPHWDYHLASRRGDRNDRLNEDLIWGRCFILDSLKIGFDLLLGVLVLVFFLSAHGLVLNWPLILAASGGISPDFFQFVYFKLRSPLLRRFQIFHNRCHSSSKSLKRQPIFGVIFQVALVVLFLWLSLLR